MQTASLPSRLNLPRLYAILDVDLTAARGLDPLALLEIWLARDIRLIQLRAKTMASGPMVALAGAIAKQVAAAGGLFLVNDRADVARLAGAGGVHVGQDDLRPADVRRILGPETVVGLSTHSTTQAKDALGEAASYLAIGPFAGTLTKGRPAGSPVGLAGVRAVAAIAGAAGPPVVAIGGITLAVAHEVLAAGAASVAVISDLLTGDPSERADAYRAALDLRRA